MQYLANIWDQLKNLTPDRIVKALERDGWKKDTSKGPIFVYRSEDGRRVTVHYHPRKTYGPKLLKELLADIGWGEEDLRRLKLIK
jgi:predicted RNA binding protein YcfA (HicA-like mRNA interferase family)